MIEQGSQGKDIVKAGSQDLVPTEPQLPAREPLDLATARLVLETVVGTHEGTFTETSDLTRVGNYDTDQVREALDLVSQDVTAVNRGRDTGFGTIEIEKQTQCGRLSLVVYRQISENLKSGEPENLYMSLVKGGNYVLESEVPLRQSDSWVRQDAVRFSDFRQGINVISMYDMKQGFSIDKFRHIWRGMRWLSANMLDWNGEFRLPEDLDRPALPKPINHQLHK